MVAYLPFLEERIESSLEAVKQLGMMGWTLSKGVSTSSQDMVVKAEPWVSLCSTLISQMRGLKTKSESQSPG